MIFFSCPASDSQLAYFPPPIQRFKHYIRFFFSLVFGSLGLLSLWPFLTPTYGHVGFLAILMFAISICIYTSGLLSKNFLPRAFSSCLVFSAATYLLLSAKIPAALVFIPFLLLFSLFSSYHFFLCFLVMDEIVAIRVCSDGVLRVQVRVVIPEEASYRHDTYNPYLLHDCLLTSECLQKRSIWQHNWNIKASNSP